MFRPSYKKRKREIFHCPNEYKTQRVKQNSLNLLIAMIFFKKNNLVKSFILVLNNLYCVQVISIMLQSDDELLKNSKYITDRTFWHNFLTSGILFPYILKWKNACWWEYSSRCQTYSWIIKSTKFWRNFLSVSKTENFERKLF